MDRDRMIARLKAARRADRAIDTARSIDSIDPAGHQVAIWRVERAALVEAMSRRVESQGRDFGLDGNGPNSNPQSPRRMHQQISGRSWLRLFQDLT